MVRLGGEECLGSIEDNRLQLRRHNRGCRAPVVAADNAQVARLQFGRHRRGMRRHHNLTTLLRGLAIAVVKHPKQPPDAVRFKSMLDLIDKHAAARFGRGTRET